MMKPAASWVVVSGLIKMIRPARHPNHTSESRSGALTRQKEFVEQHDELPVPCLFKWEHVTKNAGHGMLLLYKE